MNNLIAELEAATEGSRELDNTIEAAMPFAKPTNPDEIVGYPPYYTTSLDAALTLVPEGCGWYADDAGEVAIFKKEKDDNNTGHLVIGDCHEAPTPALALCIASLKAR